MLVEADVSRGKEIVSVASFAGGVHTVSMDGDDIIRAHKRNLLDIVLETPGDSGWISECDRGEPDVRPKQLYSVCAW